MGYRYSRDEILGAAVGVAYDTGIAAVNFASVGARLGISDRTVVYYFPSKAALIEATVGAVLAESQLALAEALPDGRHEPHCIERLVWELAVSSSWSRHFTIFIQLVALASAGLAPYRELGVSVFEDWTDWVSSRIKTAPGAERQQALAAMAKIDGVLLFNAIAGSEAARDAAVGLGLDRADAEASCMCRDGRALVPK